MENQVNIKPGLYDLPDEILLPLMIALNDTALLGMTRVCKRFQSIAKEAFAKKYHGTTKDDYYEMKIYTENMVEQKKQYHPFFSMFGENMIAIKIHFLTEAGDVKDHWINGLIQQYCTTLAKLEMFGGNIDLTGIIFWLPKPTLTHLGLDSLSVYNHLWVDYGYSQLICFHASEVNINQGKIENFIANNRQLRELHLAGDFFNIDILNAISGKLNQLKRLRIQCYEIQELPADKFNTIELEQLQELEIHLNDEICESVLQSIARGCKNLQKLKIEDEIECMNWDDDEIEIICNFVKLKSLRICASNLSVKHIKRIVKKLPNLTSLTLIDADDIHDMMPQIISICSKLNSIEFHSESSEVLRLSTDFFSRIAETTDYNSDLKVTLNLGGRTKKIVFTQEEVCNGNAIVYWNGYEPIENQTKTLLDLSDECLKKIIEYLDMDAQAALYATCTKTQQAVKEHLADIEFHVTSHLSNATAKDAFKCLAPSIRRMIVMSAISIEAWEHMNLHCTSLIELKMPYGQYRNLYRLNFVWPKLQKLMLNKCSPRMLRSLACPMLTYLDVNEFDTQNSAISSAKALYFSDWFRHLTVLKFGVYNESAEKFLMGLDDSLCQQLQEISLGKSISLGQSNVTKERSMKLINMIYRCRNLTTLSLIIPDIEKNDMKFLFESCTKLNHFTVCCIDVYNSQNMFECLKENCKDIKSIRIVIRDSKCKVFQRAFLQTLLQLFPHVSISAACADNNYVIPITLDLIKSNLP